jgi:hypothetical protein
VVVRGAVDVDVEVFVDMAVELEAFELVEDVVEEGRAPGLCDDGCEVCKGDVVVGRGVVVM